MKSFLTKYYQELLFIFVVGTIFALNLTPGSYLTGWDSLQTELDPVLGIKRAWFSAWQEYQSFGLTAGMAHAADLVRAILILPITLLLPDWAVRYTFHIFMMVLAGFGMLRLLRLCLNVSNPKSEFQNPCLPAGKAKYSQSTIDQNSGLLRPSADGSNFDIRVSPFPLLGSLFYVLNFAVIQLLFLPFEAFSVFYAALPWLIWMYIKLLTKPYTLNPKLWFLFITINLLATPAFVAQQLFIVYCLVLIFLTCGFLVSKIWHAGMNQELRSKNQKKVHSRDSYLMIHDSPNKNGNVFSILKRSVIAALLILIANAFWLLPQGYFLLTNGSVVRESKINQIATSDVLYSNIDRGNISDLISFNGFFYDRLDQDQNFLFASWKHHRENPFMAGIIYLLFAVALLGIISKNKYHTPSNTIHVGFLLVFLLCCFALLGNTPGIKELNDLIRENNFINQIFRSPFTKFAVPLALSSSYFFMIGLVTLYRFILRVTSRRNNNETIKQSNNSRFSDKPDHSNNIFVVWLLSLVIGFFILFQALPVFQGQLFSSEMKIRIPNRYFELMDYFQTVDKNERIALLPDYTFWGWFHTDYGYNGSGYLWYGIEQPIISRNFDYWSFESESYFWEIKNAVEAEDQQMMEAVFEKYDIDYIVLDKSLLPIVATQKSLQYDSLETMLLQSEILNVEKQWDDLILLSRVQTNPSQDFVSIATNLPNIGPDTKLLNDDVAYEMYGTYMTTDSRPYDAYFPFLDLFTQTKNVSDMWSITESEANITVESMLPFDTSGFTATTSSQTPTRPDLIGIQSGQTTIDLYDSETAVNFIVPFETTLSDQSVATRFPKIRIDSFSPDTAKVGYCLKEQGDLSFYKSTSVIDVVTSYGATGCIEFTDPNLDQRYGYLISTQTENISGPPLYFYILDTTKNQAYVEDRILSNNEFFILGPHFKRGLGYSFTFQNASYQQIASSNRVFGLQIYLMPFEDIHTYELTRKESEPIKKAAFEKNFNVEKKNYYTYVVSLSTKRSAQNETLILYQSYQPGWTAYKLANSKWQIANGIKEIFPFFFGEKIKNHVVINNWANGWTLNYETMKQSNNETIILVYLPQYLQYLGFGLLVIPIGILLLASIRGKKTNKNLTPIQSGLTKNAKLM